MPDFSRYSNANFALYETKDVNQSVRRFRIYGKDAKALGVAKVAIDRVVRGEVLYSGSTNMIWDSSLKRRRGNSIWNH